MEAFAPVSVVIPCYRCADTIARAISSVNAQTLKPFEVILVDDCSGDNTLPLLKSMQVQYGVDWLKIIELKINSGPATARNTGWEASSQPYIAFIDADDAWHPQKIEIQLNWMLEHPSVVLTGHINKAIMNMEKNVFLKEINKNSIKTEPISFKKILFSNRFSTRSVMLRRDVAFRFPESRKYAEDYMLWLEICAFYGIVFKISLPLSYSFKEDYGDGGLSKNLVKMEKGEILNYYTLYKNGSISLLTFLFIGFYSIIKFFRRYLICINRRVIG
jgi:glycosyltransferase involved in cell wall biosynthesis